MDESIVEISTVSVNTQLQLKVTNFSFKLYINVYKQKKFLKIRGEAHLSGLKTHSAYTVHTYTYIYTHLKKIFIAKIKQKKNEIK